MAFAGELVYKIRFDTTDAKRSLDNLMGSGNATDASGRKKGNVGMGGANPLSSGGLLKMAGVGAGAAAAGFTIIKLLEGINASVAKMQRDLADASPALKGTKEIMEKQFSLALKPMGDIMSVFMKPYLILNMKRLRESMVQAKNVMSDPKLSVEEKAEKIGKIFKDTAETLLFNQREMENLVKPMASSVDGFIQGIKLSQNNFLTGLGDWVVNFLDGLYKGAEPIPQSTFEWYRDAIQKGIVRIEDIPANIRDQIEGKVASDMLNVPQGFFMGGPLSQLSQLGGDMEAKIKEARDIVKGWSVEGNMATFNTDVRSRVGVLQNRAQAGGYIPSWNDVLNPIAAVKAIYGIPNTI